METDISLISYNKQLKQKENALNSLLHPFDAPAVTVYSSSPSHYRMRAEFRVWHDGDDLYHIMFDQVSKSKYRVDQFLPACETINLAMSKMMTHLKHSHVLRRKLFQIDYLSALSGELVVSLLYHKTLDETWVEEIKTLKAMLASELNIHFIGRARKQKIVIDRDYVIEKLPIHQKNYVFKHTENSFTQPNAEVNISMIEWTKNIARSCGGDLLELYCGAGNFSLPLAEDFNHVVGTEIAKPSVEAAQYNIRENNITNVDIVRLSAEEFVQALSGERSFRRLENTDLQRFNFETVLVDPPRAGLDASTLSCVQNFKNIFYISCNPTTLCENLKTLRETHEIDHAALFDQFPFTHHMEAGVFLTAKADKGKA